MNIVSESFDKDMAAKEGGFTFWKNPCPLSRDSHYTYSLIDTIDHAKACHSDSTFATKAEEFKQPHK